MIARLIAYFFVGLLHAVGPILLLIAIASSLPKAEFARNSLATDGKIVSFQRVYSRQFSKEVYKPVVRFVANDGQIHLMVANSRAGLFPLKPGDAVRVIYLKDHPESARIDSMTQLWMPQIILGLIGTIFIVLSARILWRKRTVSRVSSSG